MLDRNNEYGAYTSTYGQTTNQRGFNKSVVDPSIESEFHRMTQTTLNKKRYETEPVTSLQQLSLEK